MLTLSEIQINLGIKSKMASNYAHDNEDLGSTFSEDPGTLAVKRYSDSDGPKVSNTTNQIYQLLFS